MEGGRGQPPRAHTASRSPQTGRRARLGACRARRSDAVDAGVGSINTPTVPRSWPLRRTTEPERVWPGCCPHRRGAATRTSRVDGATAGRRPGHAVGRVLGASAARGGRHRASKARCTLERCRFGARPHAGWRATPPATARPSTRWPVLDWVQPSHAGCSGSARSRSSREAQELRRFGGSMKWRVRSARFSMW